MSASEYQLKEFLTDRLSKGVLWHVGNALLSLSLSVPFAATAGELSGTGLISAIMLGAALALEIPMCMPYCAIIISSKRCLKYNSFHATYVAIFLLIITLLNIASVVLSGISTATQTDTIGQKVFGGISTFVIFSHAVITLSFHLLLCSHVLLETKPATAVISNEMELAKVQHNNQNVQCDNKKLTSSHSYIREEDVTTIK